MGKLLLAYLSDAELAATLANHDFGADAGPNAARSLDALRERLAVIREQGYSLQDQEVAAGLRSVSVPVFGRDAAKPAAAINIAVSTTASRSRVAARPAAHAPARDGRRHLTAAARDLIPVRSQRAETASLEEPQGEL